MASPDKISVDLPIETFGGRVTQFNPQSLPAGASPFNQDVSFSGIDASGSGIVGGYGTRPGMGTGFYSVPFAGNPTVNYIKTFIDSMGIIHMLSLDSLGKFRNEAPCPNPPGTPFIIKSMVPNSFIKSDTLDGFEFMAVGDGQFGIDLPYQYDAITNTAPVRVSQSGPGSGPSIADETVSDIILAPAAGVIPQIAAIVSATQLGTLMTITLGAGTPLFYQYIPGNIITILGNVDGYDGEWIVAEVISSTVAILINTTSTLPNSSGGNIGYSCVQVTVTTGLSTVPLPGSVVTLSGVTDASFNGTFPVIASLSAAIYYIYNPSNSLSASGNGVLQVAGTITPGLRLFAVSFVTSSGYITKPSPWKQFTTAGGLRQVVSNIPIGPGNVVARILIFTGAIVSPATSGPFFYFDGSVPLTPGIAEVPAAGQTLASYPSMVIQDNTTTTYVVDFIDAVLENATPASYLYDLLVLGECSTVEGYAGRTFWAGERAKVQNLINMDFDGGWNDLTPPQSVPLGWTLDPTYGAGGEKLAGSGYFDDGYIIVPDGATLNRGMISQSVYQDSLGVPILNINTKYSVRVRLLGPGLGFTGNFIIDVFSPSMGVLGAFSKAISTITNGAFHESIGDLLSAQSTIPADAVLRIYTGGTPGIGSSVEIDCIEIFDSSNPVNRDIVRASYTNDTSSFDGSTGLLEVSQGDGQATRALFKLLDNKLYMVKDNGLYATQDDGQNEPSLWSVTIVSNEVGTLSAHGVGIGESWAVIASKNGAYIFWGGEPVKISQEIQPDWDRINWQYAYLIYVTVDTIRKRIHIGAPIDGATQNNVEFVLDYSQLANSDGATSAADIVAHPQAYYSTYQPTKLVAPGKARKWTLWNISMNSAAIVRRDDGSYPLLRGNGVGNGKIYQQDPTNLNDDGVAINAQYQTAYFPQTEEEQVFKLGSHRKLLKYLTGYAEGVGTLGFTVYKQQNQGGVDLSDLTLHTAEALGDFEKNVNFPAERMSLLIRQNAVNSWFQMSKLCPTIQTELITPVRGNS